MTNRPPRSRETRPIGLAVADAIGWHGLTDELRQQRLVTDWRDMVGPRIAQRAWPDGLSRTGKGDAGVRVLWIRVASSAWLQELTLLRGQLTDAIRAHVGEPALFDEVRFHLGAHTPDEEDLLAGCRLRPATPLRKPPAPVPATGAHRLAIEAETAEVADEELRALIQRVRIRNCR